MSNPAAPSRRAVLKGLGAAIALPGLELFSSTKASATVSQVTGAATGFAADGSPIRAAFIFMPNGVNMEHWRPATTGALDTLTPTLASLEPVKQHVSVLSGLAADGAFAHGDGPGDHARASACFLTGAHPFKTAGANIRNGVSVDQVAALSIGNRTRLPSLEIGCDRNRPAGRCDSGYSCAYVSNISWASETQPMPKIVDPAQVFDRLFANDRGSAEDQAAREHRLARRASVLDAVRADAHRLEQSLGSSDRRKLDEFETSVREIERRIQATQHTNMAEPADPAAYGVTRPDGVPRAYAEHMALMYDLMVLAFQTDQTRVATYMLAQAASNRAFPDLGVSSGHHEVSHHRSEAEKIQMIRRIDAFHIQQFSRFLQRLAATPDGQGTLLDHSMIMLGSGISDGNRHNHDNLPVLLAGSGGGALRTGQHIAVDRTPICNLYMSMLDQLGVTPEMNFGDATGRFTPVHAA